MEIPERLERALWCAEIGKPGFAVMLAEAQWWIKGIPDFEVDAGVFLFERMMLRICLSGTLGQGPSCSFSSIGGVFQLVLESGVTFAGSKSAGTWFQCIL